MSYKKLNLIANFYFYLILLSGVFYFFLLFVAYTKIFPGFLMQIIFLIDAIKFNNSITGLIFSNLFLINIISGIILIGLFIRILRVFYQTIKYSQSTVNFVNKIKIVKTLPKYYKFQSKSNLIFTLGFFNPKIYVSTAIFKHHNKNEIEAMIRHEENHQSQYHPLKVLIANLIKSLLPYIPGKSWLIENFITLVEVSSDQFAESKINSKLPLVSALLKFQKQAPSLNGISYFNSQSERIKILVGQKKQLISRPMTYYSLILVALLFGTVFIKNSDIFFECQHILRCVQILVDPNSKSLITPVNTDNKTILLSDHCQ